MRFERWSNVPWGTGIRETASSRRCFRMLEANVCAYLAITCKSVAPGNPIIHDLNSGRSSILATKPKRNLVARCAKSETKAHISLPTFIEILR